jgi:tRNA(fMet)-specific endonuclease VapC
MCRGVQPTCGIIEAAQEVFLPFPVLAELEVSFLLGSRRVENERLLTQFMHSKGVSILFANKYTCSLYASLFVALRRARTPIPTNDIWIAALAIQNSLVLFTRDQHFTRIPELSRI